MWGTDNAVPKYFGGNNIGCSCCNLMWKFNEVPIIWDSYSV